MDELHVGDFLFDYADDQLEKYKRIEVEEHLNKCVQCKEAYHKILNIQDTFEKARGQIPFEKLNNDFEAMLAIEKQSLKTTANLNTLINYRSYLNVVKYAAVLVMVVMAYILGSKGANIKSTELRAMEERQDQLQELLAITLISNQSASKRIQALNYAEELRHPSSDLLEALVKRLNTDPHVNVRLAASRALSKFAKNEIVFKALANRLEDETNPNILVELISTLSEMHERSTIPSMERLLQENDTPDFLKDHIKKQLNETI